MTEEQSLELNFTKVLRLPPDAVQYLLDLYQASQVFDDYADGDSVNIDDRDAAFYALIAGIPSNPFFQKHQIWLISAQAQFALRWMASDKAEREGIADEKSFMWRAGYYDIVCLVTSLVHGANSNNAHLALSLNGENFADYREEFL